MDFLPTFVTIIRSRIPDDRIIDGKNIFPLMSGRKGAKSPHEVFYYYHTTQLQAVRSGNWKLILPLNEKKRGWSGKESVPLKLINLQDDIHEDNDLSKQFPEVVDYLRKHVLAKSYILDSEAVGFDKKTEIITQVIQKVNSKEKRHQKLKNKW